eukprot:gnl/TRDRNA2_/TRDRNA2_165373_c0_seq10.p1 gnl/TRDRNA2_/TRDRNA2_165373_c0~~gnl/TRDRNA2_/TRDRNA2_165373_c0_seq10.p1  ORF type:complete len:545 (+),score=102.77 gnl/TRDRNA2_/TRDRNA2_165373_c0_seq10:230-1636(+)
MSNGAGDAASDSSELLRSADARSESGMEEQARGEGEDSDGVSIDSARGFAKNAVEAAEDAVDQSAREARWNQMLFGKRTVAKRRQSAIALVDADSKALQLEEKPGQYPEDPDDAQRPGDGDDGAVMTKIEKTTAREEPQEVNDAPEPTGAYKMTASLVHRHPQKEFKFTKHELQQIVGTVDSRILPMMVPFQSIIDATAVMRSGRGGNGGIVAGGDSLHDLRTIKPPTAKQQFKAIARKLGVTIEDLMAMKKLQDTFATDPDGFDDARVLDWPELLADTDPQNGGAGKTAQELWKMFQADKEKRAEGKLPKLIDYRGFLDWLNEMEPGGRAIWMKDAPAHGEPYTDWAPGSRPAPLALEHLAHLKSKAEQASTLQTTSRRDDDEDDSGMDEDSNSKSAVPRSKPLTTPRLAAQSKGITGSTLTSKPADDSGQSDIPRQVPLAEPSSAQSQEAWDSTKFQIEMDQEEDD